MFLADGAVSKLDIVGPPGLMHMIASARSYIKRYAVISFSWTVNSCRTEGHLWR